MNMFRRRKHAMTTGAYFVVADVIRKIPDAAQRQNMADHFATEFNRRSPSFDPYEWGARDWWEASAKLREDVGLSFALRVCSPLCGGAFTKVGETGDAKPQLRGKRPGLRRG